MSRGIKGLFCLSLLLLPLLAAPGLADGTPQQYTVVQTPALFYAEASFASTPVLMQQAEPVLVLSQVQVANTRWSQVSWNGQVYYIPSDQLVPVAPPEAGGGSLAALLSGYSARAGYRYVQLGAYAYETSGVTRPVLWRILDADGQTALLLSEMVLDAAPYLLEEAVEPEYELQWSFSYLREYLQAVFLPQAFSPEEQALLTQTGMGKVFLLSAPDYRNAGYGFNPDAQAEDPARQATATPFAKSRGAEERGGHSPYWTCSPSAKSMQMVKTSGTFGAAREERTNVGVRVAVSLLLSGAQVAGGDGSLQQPYLLRPAGQASPGQVPAGAVPDSLEALMTAYPMPPPVSPVYHDNSERNPVYTGPGEQYARALSSKGTPVYEAGSDWITVLGKDGDWALIEYEIATGYRRGYVRGHLIPQEVWQGLLPVPSAGYTVWMRYDSYLLDDVTQRSDSCRLALMPQYSGVRLLGLDQRARMFYVETIVEGLPIRGYVPVDALAWPQ